MSMVQSQMSHLERVQLQTNYPVASLVTKSDPIKSLATEQVQTSHPLES